MPALNFKSDSFKSIAHNKYRDDVNRRLKGVRNPSLKSARNRKAAKSGAAGELLKR